MTSCATIGFALAAWACTPLPEAGHGSEEPDGDARPIRLRALPDRTAAYRILVEVTGTKRWDMWTRLAVTTEEEEVETPQSTAHAGLPGKRPTDGSVNERPLQVRTIATIQALRSLLTEDKPDLPAMLLGLQLVDVRSPRFRRLRATAVQPGEPDYLTRPGSDMGARIKAFAAARQLATALDLAHQLEYPRGPLGAGRGWTSARTQLVPVPGLGTLRVRPSYVFRGKARRGPLQLALIDGELDIRASQRRPFRSLLLTGTGSGSVRFEVNLEDGSLHSTDAELSFLQELTGSSGAIVAQREAFLRIRGGPAWVGVAPHEITLPPVPDEAEPSPACEGELAALEEYLSRLPPIQTRDLEAQIGRLRLPAGVGGPPAEEGVVLALERDGGAYTLDRPVGRAELPKTLAALSPMRAYIFADRELPQTELAGWLAALPRRFSAFLVVRSGDPQGRAPAWYRRALAQAQGSSSLSQRRTNTRRLLSAQLQLCPAAQEVVRRATAKRARPAPELVDALRHCGCRRVDIAALRANLEARFGGPYWRVVPVPPLKPQPGARVADLF
ncbi:MAG: hypothetical protein OXR73_38365 [Myxococcales bacterium]|nr:hypothetical protein [Myxococcales bacterium]